MCEGQLCSHLAHLSRSPAQLVTQKKLDLPKVLLTQILIYVVQHHTEENKQKRGVNNSLSCNLASHTYLSALTCTQTAGGWHPFPLAACCLLPEGGGGLLDE